MKLNKDQGFWINIILALVLIMLGAIFHWQDVGDATASSLRSKVIKFLIVSTDKIGGKWFLSSIMVIAGISLLFITIKKAVRKS